MEKESIRKKYEAACNGYLRLFCKKHGYGFDPDLWVAGDVGGIACAGECYVDMETLRIDVDSDAPEGEFLKWYDYSMRAHALAMTCPNFKNWLKGCPRKSEEELLYFEKRREEIDVMEKEFRTCISGDSVNG